MNSAHLPCWALVALTLLSLPMQLNALLNESDKRIKEQLTYPMRR